MRLLNVGHNFRVVGGSDKYLISLGDLLEQGGHEVIPYVASSPDNLSSRYSAYFPSAGAESDLIAPLRQFKRLYSFEAASNLRKLIAEQRPDIAHLHITYGKLTSSIISTLNHAKIPMVRTLHDWKLICPAYSLRSGGRFCNLCQGRNYLQAIPRKCHGGSVIRTAGLVLDSYIHKFIRESEKIAAFIAVSKFQKALISDANVVESSKIKVIHNFIDAERILPEYRGGEYVLYFGRVHEEKGIETLLDTALIHPNILFKVVGDGPALKEFMAKAASRNQHNVQFEGHKAGLELAEIIRGAMCVVVPSLAFETFGLTALEAAAHGKVVLASRIGGLEEVIEHGVTGFLFEPGESAELAELITRLACDSGRITHMGSNARLHVTQHFSKSVHYEKLMEVYGSIN